VPHKREYLANVMTTTTTTMSSLRVLNARRVIGRALAETTRRVPKTKKNTNTSSITTTRGAATNVAAAAAASSHSNSNSQQQQQKLLRVLSWNVNGLRAAIKKNPTLLRELREKANGFDVLCLQETKLQHSHVEEVSSALLVGENARHGICFSCSTARKGYSGVATMVVASSFSNSSKQPVTFREGFHENALERASFEKTEANVEAFDLFNREGRLITCELEKAVVVNTYVPNSGEGLKRLRERIEVWEPAMRAHVACLREDMTMTTTKTGEGSTKQKPIVWMGDFNVAHEKSDLWGNWTQNEKSAGFTPEERRAFSNQLKDLNLIDSFRYKFPNVKDKFTYWSYRAKSRERNRGWRIDYALVSEGSRERVRDAFILESFTGSDHCPLGVEIQL
jgi:exodeoxyribonuclease-3